MASNNDVITEEIEALQAIMMDDDEIQIENDQNGQPTAVHIVIKPATAQNIEEQYVRVTLVVKISPLYPDEPPIIQLRNPRGIDDAVLKLIQCESQKKCEEFLGFPIIYELIELVREKLTANNTPSCPCAICLFHITQCDHFTKTQCFHYFHSYCLGRYIINCEETAAAEEVENQQPMWMTREKRELLCPICRESLGQQQMDGSCLIQFAPPEESKSLKEFRASSPEIIALQEKMNALYLRQKANGGIIDLEEEKNKFLVSSPYNENEGPLEVVDEEPSAPIEIVNEPPKVESRQGSSAAKKSRVPQGKKEYHEGNSSNSKNKSGHYRRSFRPRCNQYHCYSQPKSQDSESNNIEATKKDSLNGDKVHSQSSKSSKNSAKLTKQSDSNNHATKTTKNADKNQRNQVFEQGEADEQRKSGRGNPLRHRGGGRSGKFRGPPAGFGELERPMSSNATS